MNFRTYLLRRTLHIIPVLFGLSILILVVSRVIPGDPVRLARARPRFWLASLLPLARADQLRLLPTIGRGPAPPVHVTGLFLVDSLVALRLDAFWTSLKYLAMPAFALSVGTLAQVMRLIRAGMIEEMRRDYALAARSYGLPPNLIIYKYLLKNAFTATLTIP